MSLASVGTAKSDNLGPSLDDCCHRNQHVCTARVHFSKVLAHANRAWLQRLEDWSLSLSRSPGTCRALNQPICKALGVPSQRRDWAYKSCHDSIHISKMVNTQLKKKKISPNIIVPDRPRLSQLRTSKT